LAPSKLQGALSEQVLPDPEGDAYSTLGVAADAGLGALIPAHRSTPSAPMKVAFERNGCT
jgi:hypothetical protein